jgi:hypothetical protein
MNNKQTEVVMQISSGDYSFPAIKGSGPQRVTVNMEFPNPVTKACAVMNGFRAQYTKEDHELRDFIVTAATRAVSGKLVEVLLTFGLSAKSGKYEDTYAGTVYFTVIGE